MAALLVGRSQRSSAYGAAFGNRSGPKLDQTTRVDGLIARFKMFFKTCVKHCFVFVSTLEFQKKENLNLDVPASIPWDKVSLSTML